MDVMASNPQALRKAAIVISTLDSHSAETLLEKMPAEVASQVRELIMELADIPAEEQEAVLREFMSAGGNAETDDFDGVELDPSLADKLHSPSGYSDYSSSPETAVPSPPFRFLREAEPGVLARHLERQHPQVIAVVTAHLPPHQAAEVLKQFQPKVQADVLRRVAELDLADPDALRDIERELEVLLHDELRSARNRQSGLATVSTILNAAGSERRELMANLSRHDRDLATQLAGSPARLAEPARGSVPPRSSSQQVGAAPALVHRAQLGGAPADDAHSRSTPRSERGPVSKELPAKRSAPEISFEELTLLGDDDWAVLIRAAEPPIVLLALTGASETLLERITQQLSKREAQALRSRLQQTGPLRLSDIEHAQNHIAELASQLATRGQIRLPERRGFAAAA